MNLYLSLEKALSSWPTKEALVDGHKRFTYAQFGARVAALANALLALGVKKGQVVAALSPNCHELMEIYYACGITGIILNPINFRLAEAEIDAILRDSETSILFRHSDFKKSANADAFTTLKHIICLGVDRLTTNTIESDYEEHIERHQNKPMPVADVHGDDLAQLYYTSGTTGRAKGVMLCHENVCVNALGAIAEIKLTDADTWAHIGPMFHLLDAWSVFAVTWVGAKHVFVPYFKPHEVLEILEAEHVTITALVPTMVNGLLHDPSLIARSFKTLRLIMTAGSPIAPEQVRKAVKSFGCDYVQFYGLTETSPFLTISTPKANQFSLNEDHILEIKSRTGRPFIGVHVRVVRDDGTDVERSNKEVGEIIAKGPVVFKGYWKQPETTAAAIIDGWFHTGDLAVINEEGSINIVDRKKDMIISGGENIYSTEVEYAMYEHSAVQECAVLGLPDEEWGELVKAFVVLKQGQSASEKELIEFVRHRLAKYKAPRLIEFVSELPKTGSGKIYKKGLREQAAKKAVEKLPQETQKK